MFEGFKLAMIDTGEAMIRVRHGGSGPPFLLLHGHPQTHVMWHQVAPRLARDFTVVASDLRGYGDSSKPATTPDHAPYSKRVMARDQIAVMRQLGFERFFVAGHDCGGRCAYRMTLDHPERVLKLAVLDIVPTGEVLRRADMAFGLGYWHWFFLAQPYDLPERMIGANPENFYFRQPGRHRELFAPEALEEYFRCLRNPETIHALCEDYRAGATIDFAQDQADRGKRPSPAPCSHYGAAAATSRPGTTCWPSGASGPTTSEVRRSIAATICRRKRRTKPTSTCTRSSPADRWRSR